MKRFLISKESDLLQVVRYLEGFSDLSIYALIGDLGAGKTAFVKAWMKNKGVMQDVSSPTYGIVNEYELPHDIVYHMDLYRLNSIEEALEIGIEEYLHSGKMCLIEWPELIIDVLPRPYIEVQIIARSNETREVNVRRIV